MIGKRVPFPSLLANRLGNWIDSGHAGPEWLLQQRRLALESLLQKGLPTRKTEDWKYTDTSVLTSQEWNFPPPPESTAPQPSTKALKPFYHASDLNLVFVNGIYCASLSNISGESTIEITSLRSPLVSDLLESVLAQPAESIEQPFNLINQTGWTDGVVLTVAAEKRPPSRIHILFLHHGDSANVLIAPRLIVRLQSGSDATIAITHASNSSQACLNIPDIQFEIADHARLICFHTQSLNASSFHLGAFRFNLGRDSVLESLEAAFGASLARQNLIVALNAQGGDATLNGMYTLDQQRLSDFHTIIEHRHPHSRSRQVYKGILDDSSTAVFNGAVRVAPHACGTDGYQLNQSLLRSPNAKVFSKPELRIDNDDVRCTHGATIGQIDEKQLFYLQSRGIECQNARDMLSRAFVEDLLFDIDNQLQRDQLDHHLDHFFNKKRESNA